MKILDRIHRTQEKDNEQDKRWKNAKAQLFKPKNIFS